MSFKKLYSAPWKPEDFKKAMEEKKDEDNDFSKKSQNHPKKQKKGNIFKSINSAN